MKSTGKKFKTLIILKNNAQFLSKIPLRNLMTSKRLRKYADEIEQIYDLISKKGGKK